MAKTASEHVGVVRAEDGVGVVWLDWVGDLDQSEGDKIAGVEVVTPSNHLEPAEQSAMVVREGGGLGEKKVEELVHGGGGDDGGGGGILGAGETGADEMDHHSACANFLNALKTKCLARYADLDESYEMDVTAFA